MTFQLTKYAVDVTGSTWVLYFWILALQLCYSIVDYPSAYVDQSFNYRAVYNSAVLQAADKAYTCFHEVFVSKTSYRGITFIKVKPLVKI